MVCFHRKGWFKADVSSVSSSSALKKLHECMNEFIFCQKVFGKTLRY